MPVAQGLTSSSLRMSVKEFELVHAAALPGVPAFPRSPKSGSAHRVGL